MEYPAVSRVFARRVSIARQRRNWTQQDVVDRLVVLGYVTEEGGPRISQKTLSKIEDETSTRSNVSIEDLLALAAALNVAPVHLLAPLEDDGAVKVTATFAVPAPVLRAFVRGKHSLLRLVGFDLTRDDELAFLRETPESEFAAAATHYFGATDADSADAYESIVQGQPIRESWIEPWELQRRTDELERQLAEVQRDLDKLQSTKEENDDG